MTKLEGSTTTPVPSNPLPLRACAGRSEPRLRCRGPPARERRTLRPRGPRHHRGHHRPGVGRHWPPPLAAARIAVTMRHRYWHHCGQLLACAAVAFLLAAHEKLCTLPVRPVESHARHGDPASEPRHKPRRKPPALTERTPDCLLPRRTVREPQPLRNREWTQRQSDGNAGRPGPPGDDGSALWRLLAVVRSAGRSASLAAAPGPDDRRLRLLFSRLISRHGPPAV